MRSIRYHDNLNLSERGNINRVFDNACILLRSHIEDLTEDNAKLRAEIKNLKEEFQRIEKEYHDLMALLNKARTLAFLSGEETPPKQRFKMDRNGNLERIE